jgi:hypothetical protein
LEVGWSFCAAVVAFAVVASLVARAVASDEWSPCWPHPVALGGVGGTCYTSPFVDALFKVFIDWPMAFILYPALVGMAVYMFVTAGYVPYSSVIGIIATMSVPAVAVAWIGLNTWHRHAPVVAWVLGLGYVLHVLLMFALSVNPDLYKAVL